MKGSKNILTEQEKALVSMLIQDCQSTGDIQSKLKRLRRHDRTDARSRNGRGEYVR